MSTPASAFTASYGGVSGAAGYTDSPAYRDAVAAYRREQRAAAERGELDVCRCGYRRCDHGGQHEQVTCTAFVLRRRVTGPE